VRLAEGVILLLGFPGVEMAEQARSFSTHLGRCEQRTATVITALDGSLEAATDSASRGALAAVCRIWPAGLESLRRPALARAIRPGHLAASAWKRNRPAFKGLERPPWQISPGRGLIARLTTLAVAAGPPGRAEAQTARKPGDR